MSEYEIFMASVPDIIDTAHKFQQVVDKVFEDRQCNLGRIVVITEVAAKIADKHPEIASQIADIYISIFNHKIA